MSATAVLALDVGATNIKGALISAAGERICTLHVPTRRGDDAVRWICSAARELRLRSPDTHIVGAGLAVPGTVDPEGGVTAVNLGWDQVLVGEAVSGALNLPVTVMNDAHAGAIGEGTFGPAMSALDFLYVSIGSGIGAAIVHDGTVLEGAHGHAGELGHVKVAYPGRLCACGARGCLQTVISADALCAQWLEATGERRTVEDIVMAVESGHEPGPTIWRDAVAGLAQGLLVATSMLDPGLIVLGGGVSGAGDALLVPLRKELDALARPFHVVAPLALASLGTWSGCVGAAAAVWRAIRDQDCLTR